MCGPMPHLEYVLEGPGKSRRAAVPRAGRASLPSRGGGADALRGASMPRPGGSACFVWKGADPLFSKPLSLLLS